MLTTCRPNFVQAARTTQKIDRDRPRCITTALLAHLTTALQATSSFTVNHFLLKNSVLHFLVSEHLDNARLAFSSPTRNGHLPLSTFLISLNLHTLAKNHAIPTHPFLIQHAIYDVLPQLQIVFPHSDNELFRIFLLPYSVFPYLHAYFTSLLISLKLHSCCFFHTNSKPILYSPPIIIPNFPHSYCPFAFHNTTLPDLT